MELSIEGSDPSGDRGVVEKDMGASRRKRLNTSCQQVRCGPWDSWPSHDSIMKPKAGGFLEITVHPVRDRQLTRTSLNPTLNPLCKYARGLRGPAYAINLSTGNMHVGPPGAPLRDRFHDA